MPTTFTRIEYEQLNGRQKEAFNLQKVSAIFADLGFVTIPTKSDWGDADFIAQHIEDKFLKVQLKSRLTFSQNYRKKSLFICFPSDRVWYLYPHDEMLELNLSKNCIGREFWEQHGGYSRGAPSKVQKALLAPYELKAGITLPV